MNNTFCDVHEKGDFILNTGSPHFVRYVNEINHLDVYNEGRNIRYSNPFEKDGINVNFVERLSSNSISIRTYERGVENETLSCGTGATACAIVNAIKEKLEGEQKMDVRVQGGALTVEFNRVNPTTFTDIKLIGPAMKVFEGKIII